MDIPIRPMDKRGRACIEPACDKPVHARGHCRHHYYALNLAPDKRHERNRRNYALRKLRQEEQKLERSA